jgi:hypothetical protein
MMRDDSSLVTCKREEFCGFRVPTANTGRSNPGKMRKVASVYPRPDVAFERRQYGASTTHPCR